MDTTLTYKQQKEAEIIKYESEVSKYRWIGISLIIVGFLLFIFPVVTHFMGWGYQELNILGDYVGGVVASVWSLAAMTFIYVAYLGQRIQIAYQQIEIDSSQIEFRQQRFETTFFNLLQSHNQIESLIDYREDNGNLISIGKDCFRIFYRHFENRILKVKRSHYKEVNPTGEKNQLGDSFKFDVEFKDVQISPSQIGECFKIYYRFRQGDMALYFRSLFSLFDYVINSDESINRNRYLKIILAQMSSYQNVFLFHYALMENRQEEKKIIEKNGLLRYLDNSLMIESNHRTLYEPSSSFHTIL